MCRNAHKVVQPVISLRHVSVEESFTKSSHKVDLTIGSTSNNWEVMRSVPFIWYILFGAHIV